MTCSTQTSLDKTKPQSVLLLIFRSRSPLGTVIAFFSSHFDPPLSLSAHPPGQPTDSRAIGGFFSRYSPDRGLISSHPDFIIDNHNQCINGVVVTWVVAIVEIRLDPPGVRFPLNATSSCFFLRSKTVCVAILCQKLTKAKDLNPLHY